MIFYPSSQTGFTLVEVLVSITILLLIIVGPMQILSRSINSTNFATEQVNAWFLAQEGLELAQKGRDDLVLSNFRRQITRSGEDRPMEQFITDYAECFTITNPDGCGLIIGDTAAGTVNVTDCGNGTRCKLYLTASNDPVRSSYKHLSTGNTETPYTRVIKMVENTGSTKTREIKVTSTVTWRTGSLISSQKVEAVTYLFNVYDTD